MSPVIGVLKSKACVRPLAVGLSVLSNEHIKVLHQFTAFPAGGLMNGIYAVRHILCLSEAVFVADDNISLIFFGNGIASCGFEVDFKGCTAFRRFNLGFSVVGMLNNGDIALNDLLVYIVCSLIVFYRTLIAQGYQLRKQEHQNDFLKYNHKM